MWLWTTYSRVSTLKCRFISDRRARWSLCKRQQNRSQCRGALLGPHLLVDRELKVRKPRQTFFHTENAQARDQGSLLIPVGSKVNGCGREVQRPVSEDPDILFHPRGNGPPGLA
jgi:hypothetical protein